MLFSSLTFLFCFLPFVVITYFLLPMGLRNLLLLTSSLLFYAWGEPKYLLIMVFVIILNYLSAIAIDRLQESKKAVLVLSICLNLATLGFFKYTDFIIYNVNSLLSTNIPLAHIALPIGISFYIFQSMSYTIDVYRCNVKVQKSLLKFALYVSLFPQLIAGPIVKYRDVAKEIENRTVLLQDVVDGLVRFIIGLSKKVVLANTMGEVADKIYALNPSEINCEIAWLGAVTYSLQIFFDFSGYSDMAIGLGKVFGFKFLENFNYPYIADSITDFWRRWHISLSSWFKEYLYIPLGGNRVSHLRRTINLFVVFFATGLWHGASWNFIVWGLWHGYFLIMEKYIGNILRRNDITTKILKHLYVIFVVVIGWVFFRVESLGLALKYVETMVGLSAGNETLYSVKYFLTQKVMVVGLIAILCCYDWKIFDSTHYSIKYAKMMIAVPLLLISIACIAASGYNPFIYFRF